MSKPQWKQAEQDFEAYWEQFGKQACCYRFTDTAEVKGKLLRQGNTGATGALTKEQPSDYLVVHRGYTFHAEVKSSNRPASFGIDSLRPGQRRYARKVTAAGGHYDIFIKNEVLKQWYRVPYQELIKLIGPKKSVTWARLNPYLFDMS